MVERYQFRPAVTDHHSRPTKTNLSPQSIIKPVILIIQRDNTVGQNNVSFGILTITYTPETHHFFSDPTLQQTKQNIIQNTMIYPLSHLQKRAVK